jgi:hypothetical protein
MVTGTRYRNKVAVATYFLIEVVVNSWHGPDKDWDSKNYVDIFLGVVGTI